MQKGVLDTALGLLTERTLCDSCLGRQFALLGSELENKERGRAIKTALVLQGNLLMDGPKKNEGRQILEILAINGMFRPAMASLAKSGIEVDEKQNECFICETTMSQIKEIAEKTVQKLGEYEFNTFLIGSKFPARFIEREDQLRSRFNIIWGESIKSEMNREIGKTVLKTLKKMKKEVNFTNPEIVVELIISDAQNVDVSVRVNPVFLYGRYRKLLRGIPQTTWLCRECRGRGCDNCGGTGRMYETSVEELIAKPLLEITGGESTKFHGAGREDIDAVMLGSGRPFVIEIKEVKKRFFPLEYLEKKINEFSRGKVDVHGVRWGSKEDARKIKAFSRISRKTYKAVVELEEDVTEEYTKRIEKELTDATISQRTPNRVAHRRADKIRLKKIFNIEVHRLEKRMIELVIQCQGGLYVKELIDGDGGRTTPNISDILGVRAECKSLDVIDVESISEYESG
ncbi:MAG: tRNA pseudouridine(54/55) synthase Pus10 [Promethearchaeota archaeon]